MNLVHIASAGLVLVIAAGSAGASPYIYEGFDYTPGQQLDLLNGGTNFTNAWQAAKPDDTIQSGSLSYEDLATSGNSATFSESNIAGAEASRAVLGKGLGNDGTTSWVSFLIEPGALATNGLMEFSIEGMDVGMTGQNKGFYAVGAGTALESSTVPIVANQTVFVAIEMQFNSDPKGMDTATIFFDPTPGLTAPDVAGLTWTQNFSSSITDLFFDAADGQSYSFDEIRIGNTYADVSPVAATSTPEPSFVWMGAFWMVGLFGWNAFVKGRRKASASETL
jgi:hypothetical protein